MELFVYMWAYDKRLFCLKYGAVSFVYIWLIPAVVAAAVLALTWFLHATADLEDLKECLHADEKAKTEATILQKVMLIQEGILISVFFASVLSFIVSDRIYKSQAKSAAPHTFIEKKTGEVVKQEIGLKNTAYDFQLRNQSLKSLPALFLMVLAIFNFFFSFAFRNTYINFVEVDSVAANSSCAIPGATVLASYSIYLVLGTGLFVLCLYTLAFLFKITHLLAVLICPVKVVACKKKWHKKPRDFAHYLGEFDFTISIEEQPPCYPARLSDAAGQTCKADMANENYGELAELKGQDMTPARKETEEPMPGGPVILQMASARSDMVDPEIGTVRELQYMSSKEKL